MVTKKKAVGKTVSSVKQTEKKGGVTGIRNAEDAQRVLRHVPDEKRFYCHDGKILNNIYELKSALEIAGKKPRLVITDSQAFGEVKKIVPEEVELTSFSILLSRYKGDLEGAVKGARNPGSAGGGGSDPHRGGLHPSPAV